MQRRWLVNGVMIVFLAWSVCAQDTLDGSWSVTVNGQTVQVNADGTFRVPNIATPDNFGAGGPGTPRDFIGDDFVRVIGVSHANGVTRYAFSDFFNVRSGQTISVTGMTVTDTPPHQTAVLRIVPDDRVLTAVGQTTQSRVTATLSDGSVLDATPRTAWTSYRTSNPAIALVDIDGLITAAGNGQAFITAVNEGTAAVTRITVSLGDPLTQVSGIANTPNGGVAVNARVRILRTDAVASSDNTGSFDVVGVQTLTHTSYTLWAIHQFRNQAPTYGSAIGVQPFPGGITDAGIIVIKPLSNVDTDGDGLMDELEPVLGFDPQVADYDAGGPIPGGGADADFDDVPDGGELILFTDPYLGDTDGDGIQDGAEDFDADRISNRDELQSGTNPFLIDTDGDSFTDSAEIQFATDPLDPSSRPADNFDAFAFSSSTAFVNIGAQPAAEFQAASFGGPVAFVNLGAQPASEFQIHAVTPPTAFVNIGTPTGGELQSFAITPATSFDNSP